MPLGLESNNAEIIRKAYERYQQGDASVLLEVIDPDLEWTYLDPWESDPEPQVCYGRDELARGLERLQRQGLHVLLEEVIGFGNEVVLVTRTPGLDAFRARQADDLNIDVFTMQGGRVVAIRACRDREEALAFAGIGA